MRETAKKHPHITLDYWEPESEFELAPDKITYTSATGKERSRTIRPDGFFSLTVQSPKHEKPQHFYFLLEVDMGTEDNPRFAREKVLPGMAYIGSPQYVKRFGTKYGRYVVITTSKKRCKNMQAQAERANDKNKFLFTTFDQLTEKTLFTKRIWNKANAEKPQVLIPQ